jgi:hypothetical protein
MYKDIWRTFSFDPILGRDCYSAASGHGQIVAAYPHLYLCQCLKVGKFIPFVN